MAEKGGHSSKGFWGNVIHYDSKGKKIGESWPNFFGGYTNYDAKGKKIGESSPNLFGGYTNYDNHWNKTGSSSPNFFGGETHFDANGQKIGSSSASFLGSQNHYGDFGSPAGLINSAGSSMGTERDAERARNAAMAASNTYVYRPAAGSNAYDNDQSRVPPAGTTQAAMKDPPDARAILIAENPKGAVKYFIASSKEHGNVNYLANGRDYAVGDWVFDSVTGSLFNIISVVVCQAENVPKDILDHRLVKASPPIKEDAKRTSAKPAVRAGTVRPSRGDETESEKKAFRYFIGVILLIVVVVVGIAIMNYNLNKKHWEDFNSVLTQFDAELPGYVEKRFRSFSLAEDVKVTSHSTVEKLSYHDWNDWTEEITVTIYAPDSFDWRSERDIYNALDEAYDIFWDALWDYSYALPEHSKYSHSFPEKYKGILVTLDVDETVQIKTTNNTYEHSSHLSDYYTLNGEDHFIFDSRSSWTSSGSSYSTAKPSGNYSYTPPSSSSDPYHASDYATPEDFYDDNYDEFFSYEDAESYYQEHEYD